LWFIRKYNRTREKEEDKLTAEYKAYYRDVFVWLPHIRWETPDKKYMPYCPNCKSNARVGPHCFRDNHAGRVIVGLTETYYTVGMRHICHECKEAHKKAKVDFEAAAKEQNLTATVELDDRPEGPRQSAVKRSVGVPEVPYPYIWQILPNSVKNFYRDQRRNQYVWDLARKFTWRTRRGPVDHTGA
jgi:hypothetical protein